MENWNVLCIKTWLPVSNIIVIVVIVHVQEVCLAPVVKCYTDRFIQNKISDSKVSKLTENGKMKVNMEKKILSNVGVLRFECCHICKYKNIIKMPIQ